MGHQYQYQFHESRMEKVDMSKKPINGDDEWDIPRIPIPICYLPPIWEIIIHSKVDRERLTNLVMDDPIPLVRPKNILQYFDKRIEFTQMLIEKGMLDEKIGNAAINHFRKHKDYISAIPINIP